MGLGVVLIFLGLLHPLLPMMSGMLADGQPLEDLAGYRLYYALDLLSFESDGNYSLDTGMNSEALVTGLSSGALQFAVTAIDTADNESDLSDVVLVEVGEE